MRNTLAEAIKQTINYHLKNIHTAIPGEIVEYDYTTQKASVLPTIKEKFYTGEVLSMPIIVNVPVIFPRSADASITFPLEKGDKVLLIFSEKSLERWLSSGKEVEAGVNRRFDLSDGIAIPGLYSFIDPSPCMPNSLCIRYKNGYFRIKGDSTIELESTNASLQIGSNGTILLDGKNADIELRSNGKIIIENQNDNLLDILSDAMDEISKITVGGTPIDNPTVFVDLEDRIDSLR